MSDRNLVKIRKEMPKKIVVIHFKYTVLTSFIYINKVINHQRMFLVSHMILPIPHGCNQTFRSCRRPLTWATGINKIDIGSHLSLWISNYKYLNKIRTLSTYKVNGICKQLLIITFLINRLCHVNIIRQCLAAKF